MTDNPVERAFAQIAELSKTLHRVEEYYRALDSALAKPAKPSNRKKLGKQEVKSIRDLKRIGCSNKEIADVFDIHPSTVGRIVKGVYHR
jgi:DNA-binding NarL/FixJ family response regulator